MPTTQRSDSRTTHIDDDATRVGSYQASLHLERLDFDSLHSFIQKLLLLVLGRLRGGLQAHDKTRGHSQCKEHKIKIKMCIYIYILYIYIYKLEKIFIYIVFQQFAEQRSFF